MNKQTTAFCEAVRKYVEYWTKQSNHSHEEKLNGLAFSILRLLDGLSDEYEGNIQLLAEEHPFVALHHAFLRKKEPKHER